MSARWVLGAERCHSEHRKFSWVGMAKILIIADWMWLYAERWRSGSRHGWSGLLLSSRGSGAGLGGHVGSDLAARRVLMRQLAWWDLERWWWGANAIVKLGTSGWIYMRSCCADGHFGAHGKWDPKPGAATAAGMSVLDVDETRQRERRWARWDWMHMESHSRWNGERERRCKLMSSKIKCEKSDENKEIWLNLSQN